MGILSAHPGFALSSKTAINPALRRRPFRAVLLVLLALAIPVPASAGVGLPPVAEHPGDGQRQPRRRPQQDLLHLPDLRSPGGQPGPRPRQDQRGPGTLDGKHALEFVRERHAFADGGLDAATIAGLAVGLKDVQPRDMVMFALSAAMATDTLDDYVAANGLEGGN